MEQQQPDYMEAYILRVLAEAGVDNLSEELKADYVQQFMAEAEYRIGAALAPHLDEAAAKKYAELMEQENVSGDDWMAFWRANVPDFENVVGKALDDFAVEVKAAIGSK